MRFKNIKIWCQSHIKEILLFIFVFLVSTMSFGLGYLIAIDHSRTPIIIEKNSEIGL